ncbi:MAG: caspase family protein [bacterium]
MAIDTFADVSSELFTKLAHKRLGVPEQNIIHVSENATAGVLRGRISTLLNRLEENDTLYIYYAGHGVPGEKGKSAYILPKDAVVGAYKDPDFKLSRIYQKIKDSDVGRAYAFIDACFSGQSSPDQQIFEGVAPAGRTVQAMQEKRVPGNMTIITAGKSNQLSNAYEDKKNRLFSYFLMKGILKKRRR